jgi:[ribosomal protein S5]-alanine N-acetyltransferase
MPASYLEGALCRLRPYRDDDVDALRALADDPLVARWMTAGFASPYTEEAARAWIDAAQADLPVRNFAIEVEGAFAGGAGLEPLGGERAGVAVFGYWLGRRYWGRGIATDAARTLAAYALTSGRLRRLQASVFAPNLASARVLEKAGFTCEARLRDAYVQRDGTVCDELVYARLASGPTNWTARETC